MAKFQKRLQTLWQAVSYFIVCRHVRLSVVRLSRPKVALLTKYQASFAAWVTPRWLLKGPRVKEKALVTLVLAAPGTVHHQLLKVSYDPGCCTENTPTYTFLLHLRSSV